MPDSQIETQSKSKLTNSRPTNQASFGPPSKDEKEIDSVLENSNEFEKVIKTDELKNKALDTTSRRSSLDPAIDIGTDQESAESIEIDAKNNTKSKSNNP